MRIAFLGIRGVPANYGGFETFVEQLGRRMAARGHDVTVYGRNAWVAKGIDQHLGMRIVRMPAPSSKYLETVVHSLFAAFHALVHRYDVVYICNSANVPAVIVLMLARKRVVLNVDGLEWQRAKWNRIGRAYYRACAAIAARLPIHVVTDAHVIQDHYRIAYGRETEYFPYGTEPGSTPDDGTLAGLGLEPGQYVLYVSRLEPENNAHVVIDAYRSVRTGLPLVVVGDAPYASGYIALVEAMGAGNAIAANDVPEHRETLGDAGLFYRGAAELATVLQEILDEPARAADLRSRARNRALAEFSWDHVAEAYEDWLKRISGI